MRELAASWRPFTYRLLALSLCVPVAIVAVGALPIDDAFRDTLLPLFLLTLVWPLAGIVALFWAVRLWFLRRRLQAAVVFALPAIIAVSVVSYGSDPITDFVFHLNRLVHFATMKRAYDDEVRAMQGRGPRLKIFVWEMDPIGGSGVVYDDSDDIALPRNLRPKNWSASESKYPAALDELCRVEPVGSHYYVVSFGCYREGK